MKSIRNTSVPNLRAINQHWFEEMRNFAHAEKIFKNRQPSLKQA